MIIHLDHEKNLEINQKLLAKTGFFFYRLFKKEISF